MTKTEILSNLGFKTIEVAEKSFENYLSIEQKIMSLDS